jgi:copper chaperone CopZ
VVRQNVHEKAQELAPVEEFLEVVPGISEVSSNVDDSWENVEDDIHPPLVA